VPLVDTRRANTSPQQLQAYRIADEDAKSYPFLNNSMVLRPDKAVSHHQVRFHRTTLK
jgi:hypothetical protein